MAHDGFSVAGCEHGNEPARSTKGGKFCGQCGVMKGFGNAAR